MSMSDAKKKRIRLVREGKRNPGENRRNWHGVNPVQKQTSTFAESKRKEDNKHKNRWNHSAPKDDGSIFYSLLKMSSENSPPLRQ